MTLDHIDEDMLSNVNQMKIKLTALLGVEVLSYEIKKVDYIRAMINLNAVYHASDDEIPQHLHNISPDFDRPVED